MGQSLRQRFNPKSIAPKLKPLARPMLYLSLGLHGLLLLIPINVPEPPELEAAAESDSLDRVSMATLVPSTSDDEPSDDEIPDAAQPEAAPAPAPQTPPAQTPPAQTPPPQPQSAPPAAAVAPPTTQPEADAVEPEPSPPSSDPAEVDVDSVDSESAGSDSAESDPVVPVESGPLEDGPPPPPEPLTSNESGGAVGAYQYNPAEVAQAEEQAGGGFIIWNTWWQPLVNSGTVTQNPPTGKELPLPHTSNICLDEPPGVAILGAVVDQTGEIEGDPDLLRGTGYALLNDKAIELVKEYEFPSSADATAAYVFRVAVDYDPENCIAPAS